MIIHIVAIIVNQTCFYATPRTPMSKFLCVLLPVHNYAIHGGIWKGYEDASFMDIFVSNDVSDA